MRATQATMQDRDLVGYGATPPRVRWPNDARVATALVVNYDEGSENLLRDRIGRHEMVGGGPSSVPRSRRDLVNESFFGYGSRAGVWRLLRIFRKHGVCAAFFACAVAQARNPAVGRTIPTRATTYWVMTPADKGRGIPAYPVVPVSVERDPIPSARLRSRGCPS
jgi:peptidoglycan/xylan/chitin deacetylase (PgdA/CDA1 family)